MVPTIPSLRWRVIDIVIVAVLGVVCGLIFVVWNQVDGVSYEFPKTIGLGMGGLVTGVWLLNSMLGSYVIHKPGATLFIGLMAATVSMALGSQWAVRTIYSGLAQGLDMEVVFALAAYRRFNVTIVGATGTVPLAFEWVLGLFLSGHLAKGVLYNVICLVYGTASSIVLAGLLVRALMNALARTGTLDRFASGRGARELV